MGTLLKEIEQAGKIIREQPKKDKFGWYYYDRQPEGTRLATTNDLKNGAFKDNTPYLLYGERSKQYECHRVQDEVNPRLVPFIEVGRVFLFTG